MARIAQVIHDEAPDLVVLTEFRHAPGQTLLELLAPLNYQMIAGQIEGPHNCVCVLSRYPMDAFAIEVLPTSLHRWVLVHIPSLDLSILGVHVPNQTEIWNKREFWNCVQGFADSHVGQRAMIIGDLNTALDEDHQGEPIRESSYFVHLLKTGWIDAWRKHNGDLQEYTWFSHRQNGFRLDYCFVSPSLAETTTGARMRHDVRDERLSDHSLLIVDLEE